VRLPVRLRGGSHRRLSAHPRVPGRLRGLLRRRTVRVVLALVAAFCCWLSFSVGQTLAAPGGGSVSSKLAEWARDHYLGPVVTFGEWLPNGVTRGTLTPGAASVVHYRDGTIAIGSWGSGVRMTPDVVGVRQNLKLIVENGQIPADVNQNVLSSWGATLGGGYYVWRSGLGITRDGRVIFVYGPALDVRTLAGLLRRAGAVQALQLGINPLWMSFEYYRAGHRPADPVPENLLPTQQRPAYRYYSVYSRDFTAVYARRPPAGRRRRRRRPGSAAGCPPCCGPQGPASGRRTCWSSRPRWRARRSAGTTGWATRW